MCACPVQRSRVQLSLVAGLIAVGLCAVVGIMVVQRSGAAQQDVLVQTVARIYAKGGRLTMLDDEEDPGFRACAALSSISRCFLLLETLLLPSLAAQASYPVCPAERY